MFFTLYRWVNSNQKAKESTVSVPVRNEIAKATSASGVKESGSAIYDRQQEGFGKSNMDEHLQEENGILDPSGANEPTEALFGKIVEYFQYKVIKMGCDPAEIVYIESALASI